MFIPTGGSVYNSVKFTKLNMQWQQRKENPQMLKKEEEDPQIARFKEDARRMRESNVISALDGKLKAGGELTEEELQYLKEKNPELYKEAIEIKREREAFKKQMESCRTKDDVERLKAQKLNEYLNVAKSIKENPNIPEGEKVKQLGKVLKRVMAIQKEHTKFIQTKRYSDLPREQEVIEAEKEKKEKKEKAEKTSEVETQWNSEDLLRKLMEQLNADMEAQYKELLNNGQKKPGQAADEQQTDGEIAEAAAVTTDVTAEKTGTGAASSSASISTADVSAADPVIPASVSTYNAGKSVETVTKAPVKISIKV